MSAPAPTYATHAKESGHWYDLQARKLVEAVRYANGKDGPPTLVHARKLKLGPGQSAITRCAASYSLENWKREQVLMAALTLPRLTSESDAQFCARILADSDRQASDAAARGTAIHAAIQDYYTTSTWPTDPVMFDCVGGVVDVVRQTWGDRTWLPELCVSHRSGYGTKVDLCAADRAIVLDFKSKDFDDVGKLMTYRDHAMQLAAGGVALHGSDCDREALRGIECAAIVYVSRTKPGLAYPVAVKLDKLLNGWDMFQALFSFWKADNRYDPSW